MKKFIPILITALAIIIGNYLFAKGPDSKNFIKDTIQQAIAAPSGGCGCGH